MIEYVLVSQGCEIYKTTDREEAIKVATIDNDNWLEYVRKCSNEYEPYADNEIYVYEVIDNDIPNARKICDAWGEIK